MCLIDYKFSNAYMIFNSHINMNHDVLLKTFEDKMPDILIEYHKVHVKYLLLNILVNLH